MREVLVLRDVAIGTDSRLLTQPTSLAIHEGNCMALIGESGSGKSLTGLAIGGLLPPGVQLQQGSIMLDGLGLHACAPKVLARMRGSQIGYIFQNYAGMFSPQIRLGLQLDESLKAHCRDNRRERQRRIRAALEEVRLPAERVERSYTFQLSGGQLQRVSIACALLLKPRLLIADEPTTALDPATSEEILQLLRKLAQRTNCALLLITHDLRIARRYADRIAVMWQGSIVEEGEAAQVLGDPVHTYTCELLAAERLLCGRAEGGRAGR
ncbi:ATP-binding cassette domain-containing protein [Paenibacillus sp. SYP-B4298]|uniref:ATP-binding cassette domain-containing protein n=1 Tax=Paenibacillus sp. SYP-B4298 TaxID=2996034 RepID=UPI0022DE5CF3|nr:ABC transporter ATP-binding protein [Paenibacillus sp. SYP-B4298]